MPSRCSRCESSKPAGPAPTIPTCVRIPLAPLHDAPTESYHRAAALTQVKRGATHRVKILTPERDFEQARQPAVHPDSSESVEAEVQGAGGRGGRPLPRVRAGGSLPVRA